MKTEYQQTPISKIPEGQETLNETIANILKSLEDVRKETEENQKEKVYVWSEHYINLMNNIWKYFYKHVGEERCINSCLGFRLLELNKELLWLWLECTSGMYDNAVRDLRYILESFLQAYYTDKKHQNASMECKLEILEEIDDLTGGRLINRLDIPERYKQRIKTLYSDLCKYVHPSHKEWEKIIKEGKIRPKLTFEYDKELFEESIEFTDRVIDAIVFLLMNFSTEMVEEIRGDEIFLKSIGNVKESLVIEYLQTPDCGK